MKKLKVLFAVVLVSLVIFGLWFFSESSKTRLRIVNDITQINPILVDKIVRPKSINDVIDAVKKHPGPISIGGGRFSMGGQTATELSLFLDMRDYNKILSFSPEQKEITVQPGITWRQIQEHIDPHNLSVKIMQSYANFTVGGSLSVNVHGRYIGLGPIILSVKSIKVVLADGSLVNASPTENSDVFYGAIGGYGGLGVIVEATLELANNQKLERQTKIISPEDYVTYFKSEIRDNPKAIFHNGDIYPPKFKNIRSTTFVETTKDVTIADRLQTSGKRHIIRPLFVSLVSILPFGREIREHIIDNIFFNRDQVVWRNYEASYDAAELEPFTRSYSTYVLQEYFVPVDGFLEFVPKMRAVFKKYDVNVLNVSIRHAHKDPGSLLAWAQEECFAFVVYYKQGRSTEAKSNVGTWTRELIDEVLSVNGRYYLPYQPHATDEQFLKAYPRAAEFFALKQKLDPTNKFRNKLWDKYYKSNTPEQDATLKLKNSTGYRQTDQTYLTMPEWSIAYNTRELADFDEQNPIHDFDFINSIATFWRIYAAAYGATNRFEFNTGYHAMIGMIGVSFTAEYTIKAIYENTLGRLSHWISGHQSIEDEFYAKFLESYASFMEIKPWYMYDFWSTLSELWNLPSRNGDGFARKWERRFALSFDLIAKALWGKFTGYMSGVTYDPVLETTEVAVTRNPEATVSSNFSTTLKTQISDAVSLHTLPRYQAFLPAAQEMALSGIDFVSIAGNNEIVVSLIQKQKSKSPHKLLKRFLRTPVFTDNTASRDFYVCSVANLATILRDLHRDNVEIEHVFDY